MELLLLSFSHFYWFYLNFYFSSILSKDTLFLWHFGLTEIRDFSVFIVYWISLSSFYFKLWKNIGFPNVAFYDITKAFEDKYYPIIYFTFLWRHNLCTRTIADKTLNSVNLSLGKFFLYFYLILVCIFLMTSFFWFFMVFAFFSSRVRCTEEGFDLFFIEAYIYSSLS